MLETHLFARLQVIGKSQQPTELAEWQRIRAELCEKYAPLVLSIAKTMVKVLGLDEGNDLGDLIGVGNEALLQAINDFDPTRGISFSHFAKLRIEGRMRHYRRDSSQLIRVSRHRQEADAKNRLEGIAMQAQCVGLPGQYDEGGANLLDGAASPSISLGDVAIARAVLSQFLGHLDQLAEGATGRQREGLKRERRVIELYFRSKTPIEIARLLDCSESNVGHHIRTGLERLKNFANCEN